MYTFALQSWSLHPVILYSWLVGLTLILRFFNTLLVCQQKHNPILQTIDRKGIKKEIYAHMSSTLPQSRPNGSLAFWLLIRKSTTGQGRTGATKNTQKECICSNYSRKTESVLYENQYLWGR